MSQAMEIESIPPKKTAIRKPKKRTAEEMENEAIADGSWRAVKTSSLFQDAFSIYTKLESQGAPADIINTELYIQSWVVSTGKANRFEEIKRAFDNGTSSGTIFDGLNNMMRHMNKSMCYNTTDNKIYEVAMDFGHIRDVPGMMYWTNQIKTTDAGAWLRANENKNINVFIPKKLLSKPSVVTQFCNWPGIKLPKESRPRGRPRKKPRVDVEEVEEVEEESIDTLSMIELNPYRVWMKSSLRREVDNVVRIPIDIDFDDELTSIYPVGKFNTWTGWKVNIDIAIRFIMQTLDKDPTNYPEDIRDEPEDIKWCAITDGRYPKLWNNITDKLFGKSILTATLRNTETIYPKAIVKFSRIMDAIKFHYGENDIDKTSGFLDWLCNLIRYPNDRCTWAFVYEGEHGSGKSWIVREFLQPVMGVENIGVVSNKEDGYGHFNSLAVNKSLVVIEEGTITADHLNAFKVSLTENYMRARFMRQDTRQLENYANNLFLTNNLTMDPSGKKTAIERTERRLCYMKSATRYPTGSQEAKNYWSQLMDDLKSDGGEGILFLYAFLLFGWKMTDNFDRNHCPEWGLTNLKSIATVTNPMQGWLACCVNRNCWLEYDFITHLTRPFMPKRVSPLVSSLASRKLGDNAWDREDSEEDDFAYNIVRMDCLYKDYSSYCKTYHGEKAGKNRIGFVNTLKTIFVKKMFTFELRDIKQLGPGDQIHSRSTEYLEYVKDLSMTAEYVLMPHPDDVKAYLKESADIKEFRNMDKREVEELEKKIEEKIKGFY